MFCGLAPSTFWQFLRAEFTRDYMLECEEQKYLEKRERIYNFLLMSTSLEKVNSFPKSASEFFPPKT